MQQRHSRVPVSDGQATMQLGNALLAPVVQLGGTPVGPGQKLGWASVLNACSSSTASATPNVCDGMIAAS
jgi:hypothetical protein